MRYLALAIVLGTTAYGSIVDTELTVPPNAKVVKHEAVHDLLQGGASDDPRFGLCSGIVH